MKAGSSRRGHLGTRRAVDMLARVAALALLLASSGPSSPVAADEPNRAGLVVQFDANRIETLCIAFEGQEIAGNDFLALSGLDLVLDATSGLGITVCQIGGQGCAFPAEHCFCQCMGGEGCLYWNYFHREPGDEEWTYSPLGVLLRQVQPGSVEAWVWGDGQTSPDKALTFEAICSPVGLTQPPPTLSAVAGSPTPGARATAAATLATEEPLPSAPPRATPTVVTTLPAAPLPTEQPGGSPTPASSRTRADATGYLFFGLLVLGLILIGAVVWSRRR